VNKDFIDAILVIEKERKISKEILFEAIEQALKSALKKDFGDRANVVVRMDRETGDVSVYLIKTVVDQVDNPDLEISLEDARQINDKYEIGDTIEHEVVPKSFGRIAAQTAKQVVMQRIREAERGVIFNEFVEKEDEVLTAFVQRIEKRNVFVELGRTEGILPPTEQMPGEHYNVNDRLKVYIVEVRKTTKGPQVLVSRSHPGLVKRLFELEVPEVQNGLVQIKSIAREAGSRTKISVYSADTQIDPIGACVGQKGIRVARISAELKEEKIDIIKWSDDPITYIANALSPAHVMMVRVIEEEKAAQVVVPDNQLSLAIGKEGQNVRLAARLTGWKIDIKSRSQIEESLESILDDASEAEYADNGSQLDETGSWSEEDEN